MLRRTSLLVIFLLGTPLMWVHDAAAQSSFDIKLIVNDLVVEERLSFAREHYFVARLAFDFAGTGIDSATTISVTGKNVPPGFLNATAAPTRNEISVALDYPDPIYTSIDFETIEQFHLKLYLENEKFAVARGVLKVLGDKGRFQLLLDASKNLDQRTFERVEDPLIAALVKSRLNADRNVVNNAFGQLSFANSAKIDIARMTLGFSSASEIVAMRLRMDSQTHLVAFANELLRHIGANDVLEYLVNERL